MCVARYSTPPSGCPKKVPPGGSIVPWKSLIASSCTDTGALLAASASTLPSALGAATVRHTASAMPAMSLFISLLPRSLTDETRTLTDGVCKHRRLTTLELNTAHGAANAHVHSAEGARAALVLGHGRREESPRRTLVAVTEVARTEGVSVALVEQPYRLWDVAPLPPRTISTPPRCTVVERLLGAEELATSFHLSSAAGRWALAWHAAPQLRPARSEAPPRLPSGATSPLGARARAGCTSSTRSPCRRSSSRGRETGSASRR